VQVKFLLEFSNLTIKRASTVLVVNREVIIANPGNDWCCRTCDWSSQVTHPHNLTYREASANLVGERCWGSQSFVAEDLAH